MKPIITVFGATGAQGGGLARAILDDPRQRFALRAVTRKPASAAALALARAGAQVVAADLDDAPSVLRAMQGAHGVFGVTSFWEHCSAETEKQQAATLARAAAAAGIQHMVWSTLEDTREFVTPGSGRMPVLQGQYNVPHYDAKGEANRFFIQARVPTTLLYTSFYWDNLIHFGMQPQRLADGTLGFVLPIADRKLPGIAAADIGACAFALLARGEEMHGKSIGVAGEHLTGAQMAAQLSRTLGERVTHIDPPLAQYAALGFPGAQELANMFQFKRDFEDAYCGARNLARARELFPRLQTFSEWLAANAARIPRS
jgi:uncharacterized protein YbjT (DUF2867 family)